MRTQKHIYNFYPFYDNYLCPNCGKTLFKKVKAKYKNGSIKVKCENCDYVCYQSDLLTENEWINKNRTDLIERMLE